MEAYRDENGIPRSRTILNLSKLDKRSAGLAKIIEDKVKGKKMVALEDITQEDNRSLGEATVLKRLADKLRITGILQKHLGSKICSLVLAMTINRISLPKSRYSLSEWLETTWLPELLSLPLGDFHHNKLYFALKALEKKQKEIENDLWEKTTKAREPSLTLMLYDITSTYLEGFQNELSAYGYNRDKKRGKKQIVIGLVSTSQGRPVTIEALPGNTTDKTTMVNKVKELQKRFNIKNIVYVFDRGMKDEKKIAAIEAKQAKYITALNRSEIRKLEENNKNIQLGLFDKKIAEYQVEDKDENGRKTIRRYIICKSDQTERNMKKRERLMQKTEEELEKIKKSIKNKRLKDPLKIAARVERHLNRWKMKKYYNITIKERYFNYQVKQDIIEETEILDGIYVLVTNVSKQDLSAKQVQHGYKNLREIENNFRTIKSNLDIRPVNHRLKETTKGHIFICFLALYIRKEMELLLEPLLNKNKKSKKYKKLTFSKIQTKLREIRQSTLKADKHQTAVLNKLDPLQTEILNILKMRIFPIPLSK